MWNQINKKKIECMCFALFRSSIRFVFIIFAFIAFFSRLLLSLSPFLFVREFVFMCAIVARCVWIQWANSKFDYTRLLYTICCCRCFVIVIVCWHILLKSRTLQMSSSPQSVNVRSILARRKCTNLYFIQTFVCMRERERTRLRACI